MSFSDLSYFSVPRAVITETENRLRQAGRKHLELFVLWSGLVDGTKFVVRTVHVPPQKTYQLESGLLVRVEGDALHQLNVWLYEHGEALAVQVHAHPTDAFHSETDDTYPIVTARGSLSIVAADFCHVGLLCDDSAVYRLDDQGWHRLDSPSQLIRVN